MMNSSQQQQQYTGPAWTIIDVTDTNIFDRDLGIVPSKRVAFKLYTGKKSFVDIPVDDFTPDVVNTKVDEAASNLFDVMGLTGSTVNVFPTPPVS